MQKLKLAPITERAGMNKPPTPHIQWLTAQMSVVHCKVWTKHYPTYFLVQPLPSLACASSAEAYRLLKHLQPGPAVTQRILDIIWGLLGALQLEFTPNFPQHLACVCTCRCEVLCVACRGQVDIDWSRSMIVLPHLDAIGLEDC